MKKGIYELSWEREIGILIKNKFKGIVEDRRLMSKARSLTYTTLQSTSTSHETSWIDLVPLYYNIDLYKSRFSQEALPRMEKFGKTFKAYGIAVKKSSQGYRIIVLMKDSH